LSIFSDNCILGFLDADTIDSLLDDIVVDLSLGGSGEDYIKITSFSSSLFSFGETVGLTCGREVVTNFFQSYLHQIFDDSHGLNTSLKPLRRPFDRCQSRLEAINNGRDIKQINW